MSIFASLIINATLSLIGFSMWIDDQLERIRNKSRERSIIAEAERILDEN